MAMFNSYVNLPVTHTHNYGKSSFLVGKLTVSMAMFNGYKVVHPPRYKLVYKSIKYIYIDISI